MHFFFPSEDEEEFEESGGLDFKWRLDLCVYLQGRRLVAAAALLFRVVNPGKKMMLLFHAEAAAIARNI